MKGKSRNWMESQASVQSRLQDQFLAIVVKSYIKFFWPCLILLDFLTFAKCFVTDCTSSFKRFREVTEISNTAFVENKNKTYNLPRQHLYNGENSRGEQATINQGLQSINIEKSQLELRREVKFLDVK